MDPTESPVLPAGPLCGLCGEAAVVHWLRRLTDDEFEAHLHAEQTRRDTAADLADPQLPPPDFGPLPGEADCTRPVYGCVRHALTLDDAALVHAKTCTAPSEADLPGCDCIPEPASLPEPDPAPPRLPPGWS